MEKNVNEVEDSNREEFVRSFIPKRPIPALPDHIIVNILSRLPAEHILRCQTVCKRWKDLTSTRSFIDLHLKQAQPRMVAQFIRHKRGSKETELFLVENWRELCLFGSPAGNKTKSTCKKLPFGSFHSTGSRAPYMLRYSYNGLLVFTPAYYGSSYSDIQSFFICNPITQEKLTLSAPRSGRLLGIFQHPQTKDYTVVFSWEQSWQKLYMIRSLRPHSPWKQIEEPGWPSNGIPIIINAALHWISFCHFSHSILIFDLVTEKYTTRPYPGGYSPRLVEIEGHLAFSTFIEREKEMQEWILEDYDNWNWVRKFVIKLEINEGIEFREDEDRDKEEEVIPLGVLEGELVIHWVKRGLFGYNLQHGTLERYQWRSRNSNPEEIYGWDDDEESSPELRTKLTLYMGSFVPFSHVQSEEAAPDS